MQATPLHVPQRLARRLWHSLLGSLGLLLLAGQVLVAARKPPARHSG